jgi:hypothetical protein
MMRFLTIGLLAFVLSGCAVYAVNPGYVYTAPAPVVYTQPVYYSTPAKVVYTQPVPRYTTYYTYGRPYYYYY